MKNSETAEIMDRFNRAFTGHDASLLPDLVGENCVMEAVTPAPRGMRCEGREECLYFWEALANDHSMQFEVEDVAVWEDRANIRWTLRFGSGNEDYVRGVNLMRVHNGVIVEALGYSKTPGVDSAVLTELVNTDA